MLGFIARRGHHRLVYLTRVCCLHGRHISSSILHTLTPEQYEVVSHTTGPFLMLAGPGTGKKRVLAARIVRLIMDQQAQPSQILVLAFTSQAAHVIREQVDSNTLHGYNDAMIRTVHGFCEDLVQEFPLELGLSGEQHTPLSPAEQAMFLRDHLFELPLNRYRPSGDPSRYTNALLDLFGRLQDADVSTDNYQSYVQGMRKRTSRRGTVTIREYCDAQTELAETYSAFTKMKRRYGVVSLHDRISLALRLFRERPHVAQRIRDRYRFIMVEGFQDLSTPQVELVRRLVGKHRNLFVVGDDDQAAASTFPERNFHSFLKTFPDAIVRSLGHTFRAHEGIRSATRRLIRHNLDRVEVTLMLPNKQETRNSEPATKGDNGLSFRMFRTAMDEAEWIASEINQMKRGKLSDVAVFVRRDADMDRVIRALQRKGIPTRFPPRGQRLLRQADVKILMSFLLSLAQPNESSHLYHLITSPAVGFTPLSMMPVMRECYRSSKPLRHVLEEIANGNGPDLTNEEQGRKRSFSLGIEPHTQKDIGKFVTQLHTYEERLGTMSIKELLFEFVRDCPTLAQLLDPRDAVQEEQRRAVTRFLDIVGTSETTVASNSLSLVIPHLETFMTLPDEDGGMNDVEPETNAVRIMPMHQAMGLEFTTVFIAAATDEKVPGFNSLPELHLASALLKTPDVTREHHLMKERRLIYAAMSRASERIVFTCANDYGGTRVHRPSRFISEALGRPLEETVSPVKWRASPGRSALLQSGIVGGEELSTVSFTKLEDYNRCPMRYFFRYRLRIPTEPSHAASYGKSVHEAVAEIALARKEGVSVTEKHVANFFDKSWRGEGYESLEHEGERKEEGMRALERFNVRDGQSEGTPLFVEKPFHFPLGGVNVRGVWDRVDQEGEDAVIIEYKSMLQGKQLQRKAQDNLQLQLYCLAFLKVYNKLPIKAVLQSIETGESGEYIPTLEKMEALERSIEEQVERMREGFYEPKPSFLNCSHCNFCEICPHTVFKRNS